MATSSANDQDGHLQKRFSKITMIGMAFAILNLGEARFLAAAAVAASGGSYEITQWSTYLMFVAVSIIGVFLNIFAFDAVAHMVEEMPRPSTDAPQAMVGAVIVGGTTGIAFILVMLFCAVDIDVLLSSPTQSPLTEMILQATRSKAAATVLSVAVALCFVNGANGCVTSGSRLVWSMARDNGTPFSK
ncbi:uncharacterized protein N0V96_009686 [Colletotrichum fioriniae]|uniref:uncharacterized protein n=1 Tax=Colletotrichum fioriniae TaxID=710243 RepID=UPI0032D9CC7E|nr:hypothetical protein N0V96_009686 [Colletotrichum fioriniae]